MALATGGAGLIALVASLAFLLGTARDGSLLAVADDAGRLRYLAERIAVHLANRRESLAPDAPAERDLIRAVAEYGAAVDRLETRLAAHGIDGPGDTALPAAMERAIAAADRLRYLAARMIRREPVTGEEDTATAFAAARLEAVRSIDALNAALRSDAAEAGKTRSLYAFAAAGAGVGLIAVACMLIALSCLQRDRTSAAMRSDRARRLAAVLRERQAEVLHMVAVQRPLDSILEAICRMVEEQEPQMRTSVLHVRGGRLFHGAAPSLPAAYCAAVDGLEIGPAAGSCGTAAFTGQRIIAEDTSTDPRWAPAREPAARYGLRACWSEPVLDSRRVVVGTFAMYHRQVGAPTESQVGLIHMAAQLAAVAIERANDDARLRALAAAVNAADDAIMLMDRDLRITAVNPAFERMTGVAADLLRGRTPDALRTAEIPAPDEEYMRAAVQAGNRWSGRLLYRRPAPAPSGDVLSGTATHDAFWVERLVTPIRSDTGAVTGFVAVERDITAVVTREQVERRARDLAEVRAAAARILAGDGPLASRLSEAVSAVLRIDPARSDIESTVFLRDDADRAWCPLHAVDAAHPPLPGGIPLTAWTTVVRRAVERGTLAESPGVAPAVPYVVVPLRHARTHEGGLLLVGIEERDIDPAWRQALDHVGELIAIEILRDRTTRLLRSAREGAEAAARAKSEFLANMSHEIRTPLTAILGFTDLLHEMETGHVDPGERASMIETIRQAGAHLLAIINDVLDLSKIEAGAMPVDAVPFSPREIMAEVDRLMSPRATGRGLAFSSHLETSVPARVMGDPVRLRQILLNLVGNATKFTEQGSVEVRAGWVERSAREWLIIHVRDTGPGMDAELVGRLFEPFRQADTGVTRRHGGTGLGLAISRRFARLMGGDVVLESCTPGHGTCFRVELPLAAVTGEASDDAPGQAVRPLPGSAEGHLRGVRVLVAEDGPDNRRLIAYTLRAAGAEVTLAENGRLALAVLDDSAADGRPFDLIVTDVQMPEMDGHALARAIRARGMTVGIIALTAHARAEDRAASLAAGCSDHLNKPIDRARFIAACATCLTGYRAGTVAGSGAETAA
ncbi:MAG: response regulator [Phycisphaeraceae bacterium]|nr:response regulator [Phycisphaeraceae bacterium]